VRKFVIALVSVLAIFVFIQNYSAERLDGPRALEARAELIP